MTFTDAEKAACEHLVRLGLSEDLGPDWTPGDVTSNALIPPDRHSAASLTFRSPGVLAGLPAVEMDLSAVDARLRLHHLLGEGESVAAGLAVGAVEGPTASLLTAE